MRPKLPQELFKLASRNITTEARVSSIAGQIATEAMQGFKKPGFGMEVEKIIAQSIAVAPVEKTDASKHALNKMIGDVSNQVTIDVTKAAEKNLQDPNFNKMVEKIIANAVKDVSQVAPKQFFRVGIWGVERDASQNLLGNRGKLNHESTLESARLGNELMVRTQKTDITAYQGDEDGGARPQVTAVFLGDDYTRALREKRDVAPNNASRPLWRGNNGFVLQEISPEEQEFLIRQFHEDVRFSAGVDGSAKQPLMIKVFDSQANKEKVRTTIGIVAKINKELMEKGDIENLIGIEYGVPYSKGQHHDPNPYTDEFFMAKMQDGIDTYKEFKAFIPDHLFRLGLKDMVGEMDGPDSARLTRKTIQTCRDNGVMLEIDLHPHHTGLATDACAAAIEVCYEQDWPISVDVVEGTLANFDLDGHPSEVGTGFTSMIAIHNKLKERNAGKGTILEIGILTDEQIAILEQKAKVNDAFLDAYKDRRIEIPQSFYPTSRETHLAGGALSSFGDAVDAAKMSEKLGLSSEETLNVCAHGLNVAGYLTGQPLSVTPAMLHRQTKALHLVSNMKKEGFFDDCADADAMVKKLQAYSKNRPDGSCPFSDDEVQKYFLQGIEDNPAMGKAMSFLKDPVPGDFIAEEGKRGIHPVIVEALKDVKELDKPNRIPEIVAKLEEFWEQDLLGPDQLQIERVLKANGVRDEAISNIHSSIQYEGRGIGEPGSFAIVRNHLEESGEFSEKIAAELKEVTINSAACNAIVAGPDVCYRHITHRWNHEPDAASFEGDTKAYQRAIAKNKQGLNPYPSADPGEGILKELEETHNIDLASARVNQEMVREKGDIYDAVNGFIANNSNDVALLSSSDAQAEREVIEGLTKSLYQEQVSTITDRLADKGQKFFLNKSERVDVAFDRLSSFLEGVSSLDKDEILQIMKEKQREIEGKEMLSDVPGLVKKVFVKAGQEVKEGDTVLQIEAMKMEFLVKATRDGVIDSVVDAGLTIAQGGKLIGFADEAQLDVTAKKTSEVIASREQEEAVEQQLEGFRGLTKDVLEEEFAKADRAVESFLGQNSQTATHVKSGYNVRNHLDQIDKVEEVIGDGVIHVVGNRAGCASKIIGDLKAYGCKNVVLLHTADDKTTPIAASLDDSEKQRIASYMDQDEIISKLEAIRDANPGKKVAFHPGWGFLSEVDKFVEKCEALEGVVFAGPPSKAMAITGGKKSFRDAVHEAAPEFNPPYLGSVAIDSKFGEGIPLTELSNYVDNIVDMQGTEIDTKYRAEFDQVMDPNGMNGNAVIKSVAGGGGKGIKFFKSDETKSREENYVEYMKTLHENIQYANTQYGNPEMLVEECMTGNPKHFEVQVILDGKKAKVLGARDCSAQKEGQKFDECNIIKGDYPQEMYDSTIVASESLGNVFAQEGYQGLLTLELMEDPVTGKKIFLEGNTRLQVEHAVTEECTFNKVGKPLSLPVLNAVVILMPNADVDKILAEQFHFTESDLEKMKDVADERVRHCRLNAKYLDLEKGGKARPTNFQDAFWDTEISSHIAEKYGVQVVHGGKGGNYDSQFGAIYGAEDKVTAAVEELSQYFEVMERLNRTGKVTNLSNLNQIHEAMLEPGTRTFNPYFSTATVDQFMADKEKGRAGDLVGYIEAHSVSNDNTPKGSVRASDVRTLSDVLDQGKGGEDDSAGRY